MSGTWKRFQDWLTVVVGVLLFITPFAVVLAGSVVLNERDRPPLVGQR